MAKKFSVKSKVLFALLAVTFITASTVGLIAAWLGVSTLKEESFKKLVAVRELKSSQIENYFKSIDDEISILSRSQEVREAILFLSGSGYPVRDGLTKDVIDLNMKRYSESFGFMSIYLADIRTDRILYCLSGEVGAGNLITEEPLSSTLLSRSYRMAVVSENPDYSFQSDFEPFKPSDNALTCFVSAPVYSGENKIGVLIFQIAIDQVNKIMTYDQDWENMGLGETGETFLVGEDFLIRNQSRFLIEDPGEYYRKILLAGMPLETVNEARRLNSAIGMHSVTQAGSDQVMGVKPGTAIFRDYRGTMVLAAFKSLKIKDLNWLIVSKIDQYEVLKAIRELFRKFILYMALLFILAIALSFVFARDFSRPVEALARANEQLKAQSAAMKSAANGIIITDINGVVKWVNPAFSILTGYDFGEIVGNKLKMLNSGVQSKDFFAQLWKKILAGEVWHGEIVNKRKDGILYTEEMTITPVHDSEGKISQFVAIKHDISERKRLEQIVKSANARMESELNVAKDIQMSMLPLKFPAFPERNDIDVYARLIPAREVGGDFYDFFFIDEENLCFVVGDVSGKGVPAALFMAVTKALIKAGAGNEKSTGKILTLVNREISKENENSMFITVFLAILNTTTGYLVYTNAGHNPSFVMRKSEGEILKLSDLHGVVIGAMEGIQYKETVLQLGRGDTVFAYTDGVTEAMDSEGKLYSEKRLVSLLENHILLGCKDLVQFVAGDVINYENGAEQADDITILSIHFSEQTEDSLVDFLNVTITNKVDNIAAMIGEFEVFAGKHLLPVEVIQKINIVFDELLMNTISYAFEDDKDHDIEIKIRFYNDRLMVTIMDDGIPYNPFDRIGPDTSLGLEEREIGGLGVHLVKLLVDDYSYEYKKEFRKNVTSFKKRI